MLVRRKSAPLMLALVVVCLPSLLMAQEEDPFFEADFDGGWVGTIRSGSEHVLLQVLLNVHDRDAVGTIFSHRPDDGDEEITAFSPNFRTVKARKVIAEFEPIEEDDESSAAARRRAVTTLVLKYKAATDSLAGRAKGATRGRLALVRMDPELPLQRLWTGSVKLDGESRPLLMQLTEIPEEDDARSAVDTVEGEAWVGDEQGSVEGTRSGNSVELAVDVPSGELTLSLRLKRRNGQLKGSFARGDDGGRLKLLPVGSNNGKPMKARKAVADPIPAGETAIVAIRGKNFGTGVLVHADEPDVQILGVDLVSPRRIDSVVRTGADLESGTEVSLRVINGDGQTGDRPRAFAIADPGGDDDELVSFAADVQPIFSTSCASAGCHSSGSAREGLVLASGSAFANIVGVPSTQRPELDRIRPGDPDNSYLINKIRGDAGIQGARMPLDRTPLTQAQIDTIVAWVQAGAENNRSQREE